MPRFHFDTLDGDRFISDEAGLELPSIEAAKAEAARSLAETLRDMPGSAGRQVVVEVSDEEGRPLFRTILYFEVEELA